MTINVIIIDDSAVVRQVLSSVLEEAPDITVIKVASDPIIAQKFMQDRWPDVIILDIEMPRMDGLTFLRKIMSEHPTPVVICSSLTKKSCNLSLEALSLGATNIITKPELSVKGFLLDAKQEFWQVVRAAAQAKTVRKPKTAAPSSEKRAPPQQKELVHMSQTTDRIVAIGTSTGGTIALEYILPLLTRTCPGIAVVQHMPEKFTSAFAARLNDISQVEVLEAQGGERLIPGRVLIAPGGMHLEVTRSGAQFISRVFKGPPVNRHCPSVDVLFRSVAKNVGRNALGIIMTGMGADGAHGLLEMKLAGSDTVAQDEETSVVFGMPKEAIQIQAARKIVALEQIPGLIQ